MAWNILRICFIVLLLFIAPRPEVYSRERLMSLRSRAALLSRQERLLIAHLGLRRRGCRGGRRRRLQAGDRVTSSVGLPAGVPAVFVNKDQLIDGGCSNQHVTTALPSVLLTSTPVQLRSDATFLQSMHPVYSSAPQPPGCSPVSLSTHCLLSTNFRENIHTGLQPTSGTFPVDGVSTMPS